PSPNGFQVCQKLKENPDFQRIPIILLTGKGTEGDRFWGMEAGADEYLTKPFDPRELLQTVKTLLEK
ncbi:MAG TPA: response regulator, partial [Candidatus Omnitrophota bacterium]|nr:response regulator [Candidatus Omnitrophota bacterium]